MIVSRWGPAVGVLMRGADVGLLRGQLADQQGLMASTGERNTVLGQITRDLHIADRKPGEAPSFPALLTPNWLAINASRLLRRH